MTSRNARRPAARQAALLLGLLCAVLALPAPGQTSPAASLAPPVPELSAQAMQSPAVESPATRSPDPGMQNPNSSSLAAKTTPVPAPAPDEPRVQPSMALVNGRPYVRPTPKDQFVDYVRDSYWWPAMLRSTARALYSEARGKPSGWGQDLPGFGQRLGSAELVTAINGNVRYGMEMLFKEDMRYIPCHGCGIGRKIGNAFLAEVTARHDSDGHRFFTVTPIVADFAGPIIANSYWYPPGHGPLDGLVATRTVVATRVGGHLFREFIMERRHKDRPIDDVSPAKRPTHTPPLQSQPSPH